MISYVAACAISKKVWFQMCWLHPSWQPLAPRSAVRWPQQLCCASRPELPGCCGQRQRIYAHIQKHLHPFSIIIGPIHAKNYEKDRKNDKWNFEQRFVEEFIENNLNISSIIDSPIGTNRFGKIIDKCSHIKSLIGIDYSSDMLNFAKSKKTFVCNAK